MRGWIGHCGTTDVGGDCAVGGERGSWDTGAIGVRTLSGCARHCEQHCSRCNFVSFNLRNRDCSWYTTCPRLMRTFGGRAYTSKQVRSTVAAPPPPPPQWMVPAGAAKGYCSLMGPGLGDCERDDQGSWPGVRTPDECIARCASCRRCRFVSFTLANATEGSVDRGGSAVRKHPPYWWRCRWYRHCRRSDLRRSPPGSEPWQYSTVRPSRSMRSVGAPSAASEPIAAGAAGALGTSPTAGALSLGLVTLLELRGARTAEQPSGYGRLRSGSRGARAAAGEPTAVGGMVQWCQNARRLAELLPATWRIDQVTVTCKAMEQSGNNQ